MHQQCSGFLGSILHNRSSREYCKTTHASTQSRSTHWDLVSLWQIGISIIPACWKMPQPCPNIQLCHWPLGVAQPLQPVWCNANRDRRNSSRAFPNRMTEHMCPDYFWKVQDGIRLKIDWPNRNQKFCSIQSPSYVSCFASWLIHLWHKKLRAMGHCTNLQQRGIHWVIYRIEWLVKNVN